MSLGDSLPQINLGVQDCQFENLKIASENRGEEYLGLPTESAVKGTVEEGDSEPTPTSRRRKRKLDASGASEMNRLYPESRKKG
ncbi:hypothetical protein TNCV_5009621 [Trichonephila clavipes]|nr:hypothetical protein TNCV_5009621 [Trichonephila clavipes]